MKGSTRGTLQISISLFKITSLTSIIGLTGGYAVAGVKGALSGLFTTLVAWLFSLSGFVPVVGVYIYTKLMSYLHSFLCANGVCLGLVYNIIYWVYFLTSVLNTLLSSLFLIAIFMKLFGNT